MKAFTIKVGDKLLDYRFGQKVNLQAFSKHLQTKGYVVEKLWNEKRHVVGIVNKSNEKLFVKLATSEGMSRLTENEFEWNKQFNELNPRANSNFWAPQNFDSGYFANLFYLITDFGQGGKVSSHEPNSENYLEQTLDEIIKFSELIQNLKFTNLDPNELSTGLSYQEWFVEKTRQWFEGIPGSAIEQYKVGQLMELVEKGTKQLESRPRHGDFAPWHIFKQSNGKLFLFDGEHALSKGVEYYDIAYYIQRIFGVLQNKEVAEKILNKLRDLDYDFSKLQTVLAARAIGGFLDKSFHEKPDYKIDQEFKNFVATLI